jgi:4-hydroxybenzoyl-CoA thioesterase
MMEEARERFLQSLGYLFGTSGVGFVMTDVAVMYLRQGHYGQTLEVWIGVSDITVKGFDMVYKVADAETGLELARAKTGLLFYDYHKQRPVSIPQDLRRKLSDQE